MVQNMDRPGILDVENPALTGDPALAAVVSGLHRLRAEDRAEWCPSARSARVLELGQIAEAVNAELVRAVATWDGAGDYAADGSISSSSWLAHRIPMTRAASARLVAAARLTQRCDRLSTALANGVTTVAHVEQTARAIRRREDIFETHGDELLDAAETVTPEEFRECAAKWRSLADDLVGSVDDPFDSSRDELTLSPTSGGLAIRGWFHTAAGVEILNLIDSFHHPEPVRGERAPRTLRERRAAALLAILFGERAYGAKNIDVTIDERTMRGDWPDDLVASRSNVDGYGPVPPELIRSWLTNAALRRVVTSGSEIVDFGTAVRFATPAQKRMLKHRDGGCVVPDCPRPGHWTDAHHTTSHAAGGRTNLDELALVCRTHHRMAHQGWRLFRDVDGNWQFEPPLPPGRGPPNTW